MAELTLEALAQRVEVLEQAVADIACIAFIRQGTGDWDAAAEAAKQIRDAGSYDFEAWGEQRAFDLKHAEDHLK